MLTRPSLFNAPEASRSSLPDSGYIQPTLNHGLRIWWAYYWPTILAEAFLGFFISVSLRLLYQEVIISARTFLWASRVERYSLVCFISLFSINYVLRRRFRRFRIALLPRFADSRHAALPVTIKRGLRVWWTFSWRTVLFDLAAFVVVLLPLQWFVGIFRPSPVVASIFFLIVGTIVNGAIALFVIYSNILDEEFGDFRLVLLPREPSAQPAAASNLPAQGQPAI